MANTVSYLYEILDRYSRPLQKISKSTKKFRTGLQRTQKQIGAMSRKMDDFGKRATSMQSALGALGLSAALTKVVSVSSDMEDAMSDVSRVTGLSGDELLTFENTLERMAEELGKSKRGMAEMAFEAGKLGVLPENMEKFLMMTSRTAIAFDMMDSEAGRAIGSIRAKMGLMDSDTQKLLDSMNFLADNTSASGERMVEIVERMSGTFKLLKLPPEVAASFAGFADQVEVSPQLAASGLNMMIRQMRKMPGMTTKLMTDPIGTVNAQLEKMAAMGPELQNKFIQKVFGPEAGRFVEKAVANIELFKKTTEAAMSTEAVGSMQRELEEQLGRSSKHFERFGVILTNTLDALGDALKPMAVAVVKVFSGVVSGLRDFAKEHPGVVRFIGIVGALVAVVGTLTVGAGIAAAALAPFLGMIAGISAPILLATAGIVALVALFQTWIETGHPVIDMILSMGDEIGAILTPFGELFGLLSEGSSGFDILGGAIERIGFLLQALLTPLKITLQAIRGVVQASTALASGDVSGAVDALATAGSDIFETGLEGFKSIGNAVLGMDNADAVAQNSKPQDVNVSGNIGVSASSGAELINADINLNGGANVANGG